jgi:Ni2+-binding GTPase involved in maturation of urease and hydrogenase
MIGGFLGAGKTTALLRAAERLTARGLRVGLITNDQSGGLVDTALARARDLPVAEIAGGCFCCRFTSLVDAAAGLDRDAHPDVFLAEPVGSCTDLQATVNEPLRHMYGDRYRIAPLSVLIDPARALRVLGIEAGQSFSPKVLYVYRKQLEEAEVLAINKIDAVSPERVRALRDALTVSFPSARVVEISARSGQGFDDWLSGVVDDDGAGRAIEIDYDTYAEGEARLGWLNCTARVSGGDVDGDELLLDLARSIRRSLDAQGAEIAHLKMTLTPDAGGGIAAVNVVGTDAEPDLAFALDAVIDAGELTLNLRAEADPERLERIVREALSSAGARVSASIVPAHLERFRPARPVPTHRMAISRANPWGGSTDPQKSIVRGQTRPDHV